MSAQDGGLPRIPLHRGPMPDLGSSLGIVILSGLVLRRVAIASTASLELFGPGEVLAVQGEPSSDELVTTDISYVVVEDGYGMPLKDLATTLARRPNLAAELVQRAVEQCEQAARLRAVLNMPRVEDRLLACFGLLAERYGTVRPEGFLIPLELTHEALGEIVGARRPTVSLALKDLNADGRLVRGPDGWVLAHAAAGELSVQPRQADKGLAPTRLVNHVRATASSAPRRSIA